MQNTSPLLANFEKLSNALQTKDEQEIKRQTLILNTELQKASPEEIQQLTKQPGSTPGFTDLVEGVVEALHLGKKIYDFVQRWSRR